MSSSYDYRPCVCMYVCMYVCTSIFTVKVVELMHLYVCVCLYVCIHVYMCWEKLSVDSYCVCVYVCMYVCTFIRMYVCMKLSFDSSCGQLWN